MPRVWWHCGEEVCWRRKCSSERPKVIEIIRSYRAFAANPTRRGRYLREVQREAERRSYHFDATKIGCCAEGLSITVTRGQMDYELAHLRVKLLLRYQAALQRIAMVNKPEPHPLFMVVAGDVEAWEWCAERVWRREELAIGVRLR